MRYVAIYPDTSAVYIELGAAMSPVASRNIANTLILVAVLPVLLWLCCVALVVLRPSNFLPWTGAAVILFGAPAWLFSFFFAIPLMLYARNRASQNTTLWTRSHKIPTFIGAGSLVIGLVVGIWIAIGNSHW